MIIWCRGRQLDKVFCRVSLTDTLQLVGYIFTNSPVAIYLLPGGMYYTLNMLYWVFTLGNKQSVLSVEDLLLPAWRCTYIYYN